jgi:hypothetical protein
MSDINMNIQEYTYHELLELFNIDELSESNLKIAYKKTMKTHPDHSNLDKSYFLFFVKAFKLLKKVFDLNTYRDKHDIYNTRTREKVYQEILEKIQVDKLDQEQINIVLNKNQNDFNIWFNKAFDKLNREDSNIDTGYEEWFRSEDNYSETNQTPTNIRDMHRQIEQQKRNISKEFNQDIIQYNNHQNEGGYDLSREKCDFYDASVFTKLPYQDLKKAHTETVIPVSETQYHESKQYTLNEYKNNRDQQIGDMSSYLNSHQDVMREFKEKENDNNVQRYFSIAKQMEQTKQNQQIWNSTFKQITY